MNEISVEFSSHNFVRVRLFFWSAEFLYRLVLRMCGGQL